MCEFGVMKSLGTIGCFLALNRNDSRSLCLYKPDLRGNAKMIKK